MQDIFLALGSGSLSLLLSHWTTGNQCIFQLKPSPHVREEDVNQESSSPSPLVLAFIGAMCSLVPRRCVSLFLNADTYQEPYICNMLVREVIALFLPSFSHLTRGV